jgi:diguanylate cyclase (GGDEF)-like protein
VLILLHFIKNLFETFTSKETSLLICDVDFFKKYNDFYGHAMGDKALRLVADTLKGNLHGDTDFLARYGGEEFVIVLNNTSPLEAESVANNLISSIKSLNIAHKTSDISDRITISIGSHTFVAADLTEYSSLFEQADKALYLAKKLGRDRVCSSISLDQFK